MQGHRNYQVRGIQAKFGAIVFLEISKKSQGGGIPLILE
jgi:hypothetical protein